MKKKTKNEAADLGIDSTQSESSAYAFCVNVKVSESVRCSFGFGCLFSIAAFWAVVQAM